MNRNTAVVLLAALAVVGLAGIGVAQSTTDNESISKQQAAAIAEREVGGTATKVLKENEGGPVYEVQVKLSNGSMKEVEVDGTTGKILEIETAEDELF